MSAKRRIKASGVRFIKLGRKGEFEKIVLKVDPRSLYESGRGLHSGHDGGVIE